MERRIEAGERPTAADFEKFVGTVDEKLVADVLSELNRAQPGQGGPLAGLDYKSILSEAGAFLTDDSRGFTRFINIVKARGPH